MTLTLSLSPELEQKLREQSARLGKAPDDLVLEAIQERLSAPAEDESALTPGSQLAAFREWLATGIHANPNADLSRDAIYGNRGE